MSSLRMEPRQEMSVYYVGKPQEPGGGVERVGEPPTTVVAPVVPAPAARSYRPGTTGRPYEVSSRVFSTARTAIVLTVLVTCIAGAILLLYSIDDHWKPDWKTEAYCHFDSLIQDRCSSESIDRLSAIIQSEADHRFRHFNGDTNHSALRLATAYFRRCCDLYSESDATFGRMVSTAFAKNLTIVDVITLLSDRSPLIPIDVWQAVPCENSTCTLWKCEPTAARRTLLGATSFLERVAALNGTLIDDHKRVISEVYPILVDSLLAACAHSNDSAYELFEDDSRYAIASASFKALEPFGWFRRIDLKWFVADTLIGVLRPRSIEFARGYFSGLIDGGEAECLDSTKSIFGNLTFLPYIDEQAERFAETMEQVPLGKRLNRFFGSRASNTSRLVLGVSDVILAEIDGFNTSTLTPLPANATFGELASYEQQLDAIYHGNRRLKTALVEKSYTEDGKLVVPLILAKLLDVADNPVKDSLAQLLLRNADQGLGTPDDEWALPDTTV